MSLIKGTKIKTKQTITSIEDQFKKKSLHQHILDLPDTYIGSVENDLIKGMYIYDEEENLIKRKDKYIVLGLYKIFDEILVNAADNTVRDSKCNIIKVNIDKTTGEIQVLNNGSTIPIELHKEYNIYVPELIFGNLLTSGNYDQKGKTVGGKNGLGSKCISSDTLVPLFNGEIKCAEDLTIEDKLIGDDGKIRNIKKIIKGHSEMYEIKQTNGESYKVNDEHILTLHMPSHKQIYWNSLENSWSVLWWDNKIMNIKIKTIKLYKMIGYEKCIGIYGNIENNKRKYSEININERKISQKIFKNKNDIKNAYNYLENFCKNINDCNIIDISIKDYINLNDSTKLKLEGIRSEFTHWEKKKTLIDPYKFGLTFYESNLDDVIQNKNNPNIPLEYIVNDRNTRLLVLAGIIDSYGEISPEKINIHVKINKYKFKNDILLIARSLGFYCKVEIIKYYNIFSDSYKEYYIIEITGNITDITNFLVNKSNFKTFVNSKVNSTGQISVENIGEGDYVGIEIDSNQRFVINDFTVTHNCANIYSTRFDVEILNSAQKKKYFQRFTNNMFNKEEPIITNLENEKIKNLDSYTKITFLPDYKRFGLESMKLNDDMISLLKKRVYDLAGSTNQNVKVYLNDKHLNITTFQDYIKMFYTEEDVDIIYEEVNERWSIGVVFDPNSGFQHMTFVNKICTFQGGTHLNYIMNQIVDKITEHILSKHKTLKIKPHQVKENLTVFINSTIEDPSFSSQSKETLTTKSSLFNIKCELSDKFIQKICKTGIINEIVQVAQIKQLGELEKSDGKKNISLKNLTKLDDARLAGSKRSSECRLIVTEGDSAKTHAISGLEIIGRDLYGVFPLKGKLLNVRNATPAQLLSNEEIKNLKQIMGLKQNTIYGDTKKLRYGGIIILTDADVDGSHIKGLLINFFHYFWPSLLKIEGFIQSITTPIIKAYKVTDSKKKNPEIFHTLTEYKKWCEKLGDDVNKKYKIKYFKGLGTSTVVEAKESYIDLEKKIINYVWEKNNEKIICKNINDDISDNSKSIENLSVSEESESNDKNDESYKAITLAFAKQKENERKEWVRQYNSEINIDNEIKKIPIYDFINKDLIHFSYDDNIRSIPDLVDGLKPSQRKILFGAFKRKLDNEEIKVAQLSGYISEHTGYHHGEASLQGAIIGMAQNFCGSNNINILSPNGNFGTRRMGGKDASSSRYIFTNISPLTRLMFINKDEPILDYLVEEGDSVEPERYYPIIPLILVNGSEGIGTGFSTTIPPFNPLDIITNIKNYLNGIPIEELIDLQPWYLGFIGKIEKENSNTFLSKGIFTIIDEYTVQISELPIGTWTQNYIDFLAGLLEKDELIHDYENNSGNHKINIKIYFKNGELQKLLKTNNLEKKLKLITPIKISNMHVYKNNIITKYFNPNQMLKDYIDIRLKFYIKRKEHYLKVLENELNLLTYKRKFIQQIINREIIIQKRKKEQIIEDLVKEKYPQLSTNINSKVSYDYLTNIPLFSLTEEKIEELENDFIEKTEEHNIYSKISVEQIWLNELDIFEKSYIKWINTLDIDENVEKKIVKKVEKTNKSKNQQIEKSVISDKIIKKEKIIKNN